MAATATCIRLGVWQLARMHEKHVLHAAQRARLAEPPIEVEGALPRVGPGAGRRVHLRGRWERSVHVLLSGRTHLGAAGVSLVTPVRLPSGEAVLVERGWLEGNRTGVTKRSGEHTSALPSPTHLVCRLLLGKKKCSSISLIRLVLTT